MMSRRFADFTVGRCFVSRSHTIDAAEIVEFARQFDPQAAHLDEQTSGENLLGGLAASGWQTAAISMRLFVETMEVTGGIIGRAVDELRWPVAVRPGDTLRVEIEIIEARLSKSLTGFGIMRYRSLTKNQHDVVVQSFVATALLPATASDMP
ncbi:MAG: MaoC family dehydratase [Chthoniobacterales bacterium]|nr:MaoC family dehydratase [Chthoniobacterales bacterium]